MRPTPGSFAGKLSNHFVWPILVVQVEGIGSHVFVGVLTQRLSGGAAVRGARTRPNVPYGVRHVEIDPVNREAVCALLHLVAELDPPTK